MGDDRAALTELFKTSKLGVPHSVLHYLYFPTRRSAASVAAKLRKLGFKTEERLGADGANWLVLARHEIVPTKDLIAATRKAMEELVIQAGGEYDGWEAEVQR